MSAMASQITSLTIVYSTVLFKAQKKNHQSCASLAFVRGIHRWPVNSPHKGPVTRKMFPFDDVIMRDKWTYIQDLNKTIDISDLKYMRAWLTHPWQDRRESGAVSYFKVE